MSKSDNAKRPVSILRTEEMRSSLAFRKDFIKHLEAASGRHFIVDVFGDAVHMMACSLWKPFAPDPDKVEADFAATRKKYNEAEYGHIVEMLSIVVRALEHDRKEFLGKILEEIGASNTHRGQFLTPQHIAHLMAQVTCMDYSHVPGEIVTINDPACGASVMLVEGGESYVANGVPQRDVLLLGGDVDGRACDISYVELSLLGYAARIDHMDALSGRQYGEPRFTPGYFLHAMPMRLSLREMKRKREAAEAAAAGKTAMPPEAETAPEAEAADEAGKRPAPDERETAPDETGKAEPGEEANGQMTFGF